MNKPFSICVPLDGNLYTTTVRLTVGGIASAAGLDVDRMEDLKVCVGECLLIFKRNGYDSAELRFTPTNGVQVEAVACGKGREDDPENEISYAILEALVDRLSTESTKDGMRIVLFCQKAE